GGAGAGAGARWPGAAHATAPGAGVGSAERARGRMDRMGIALDLTGRAVDVGYVGARVAVDTWLRWIGLASRLSVTAFGQGVAAIRGVDTARPVMDVFDAYLAQLADLPGRAGKAFELEWEATP